MQETDEEQAYTIQSVYPSDFSVGSVLRKLLFPHGELRYSLMVFRDTLQHLRIKHLNAETEH